MGYIYIHTNRINGKKYVGQTTRNPKKRWCREGTQLEIDCLREFCNSHFDNSVSATANLRKSGKYKGYKYFIQQEVEHE